MAPWRGSPAHLSGRAGRMEAPGSPLEAATQEHRGARAALGSSIHNELRYSLPQAFPLCCLRYGHVSLPGVQGVTVEGRTLHFTCLSPLLAS